MNTQERLEDNLVKCEELLANMKRTNAKLQHLIENSPDEDTTDTR